MQIDVGQTLARITVDMTAHSQYIILLSGSHQELNISNVENEIQ